MKNFQKVIAKTKKHRQKILKKLAFTQKKILTLAKSYRRQMLVRFITLEELYGDLPKLATNDSESISTTETLQMPFYFEAQHLQGDTYSLPPLYTITLSNFIFCARYNIILTQFRKIISNSISTQTDSEQFSFRALNFSRLSKLSGHYTLFRSHKNEYYHTIIDNLPRLYLLHQSEFRSLPEIRLLCAGEPTKVETFFLEKLLPDNVTPILVNEEELFQIEHLIFPSFLSRRYAGYLPPFYLKWFLEKVAPQRSSQKNKRIFISRVQTQRGQLRCILNEDELCETLKQYGFQKYVLEHLSIEEQIALFYDAEFVIGAHGAGLSNIIFSQKIKVLELFPIPFVLPHYYYLCKSCQHTYRYWCGQEPKRDNNFIVNVAQIEEILDSLEQNATAFNN
ncbi:glycosyltransferase family 61 protein [Candidatus Gracilibacteria bacterium]|nr:glycosyltransferase family 61 protein [Candidatus Gracilibacteria bacterium]NJM86849.1 glycosyltransferase family 61 protein [Hydrococcus sp. RU_2_2]